ncbi:MAG TPA: hemerythrin domain-containing protein [Acidimicrobiales bacterium]|jgi:hemerythrin superfamily protein|nr:hemerythrin domain-containing protein [Acidimicrobiales bacterium]
MPDPVMQLIEEHNRLRRLFKQVPRVGGHQSAEQRANAICDLLTIHSRLEEAIVYPAVREFDEGMATEAESAHERIDELVEKIRTAEYADNGEVKRDIEVLEQEFENHARWEEDELLPRVSGLDRDKVDELGRELYEKNQELLREFPGALDISAETEGFIASPRI